MNRRTYIETTIPSFYYEIRTEPEIVARRNWTVEWWDNHHTRYEAVTSIPVIEELERGNHPNEIVDTYIENSVMPKDPRGDALHLALASYHHCHFLLTWNCAHLANANKFEHIRHVNTIFGLFVPIITTPVELIDWEGG